MKNKPPVSISNANWAMNFFYWLIYIKLYSKRIDDDDDDDEDFKM